MNHSPFSVLTTFIVLLLTVGIPEACLAEANNENAGRALAKAQALLKQVNAQKIAAETELAALKLDAADKDKQLATLKSDLKTNKAAVVDTTASLRAAEQKGTGLSNDLERTKEKLDTAYQKLKELGEKYKSTAMTLRETESARLGLETDLASTNAELQDSEKKNLELYKLNRDMVSHFSNEGVFSRLVRSEAVTGLGQIKTETLLQEYEGKLDMNLRDTNRPAGSNP
jgi:chromosome segregation ATPase